MTPPPLAAAVPDATSPRSVMTTRWPSAAKKYPARHPMTPAPITTTSADRVIGCEFRRGRESYLGDLWDAASERTLEITGATSRVELTRLEAISMGTSEEQALRPRISLRVGFERAAEIRITDGRGRPRLGLWIGYDDEPGIWLLDELARPRIGMKVLAGGIPRLWLFEESTGRVTFSAP